MSITLKKSCFIVTVPFFKKNIHKNIYKSTVCFKKKSQYI